MIDYSKYPKVEAKLNNFIKRLMNVWVEQAVGEGMEENELSEEYMKTSTTALIGSQPRLLYDFLDENFVYLQPHLLEQLNPDKGWVYELSSPKGLTDEETTFKTRKDAEIAGFNHSFEILEGLL